MLDGFEGLGQGYDRRMLQVRTESGKPVDVEVYLATDTDSSLLPYDWYLQHVLTGAREMGLPRQYIQSIASVRTLTDPDESRASREMAIYR